MLFRIVLTSALICVTPTVIFAQQNFDASVSTPSPDEVFNGSNGVSETNPLVADKDLIYSPSSISESVQPASHAMRFDSLTSEGCVPASQGCDSIECEMESWCSCLLSDVPLLSGLKNQALCECWTYSVGGELRYRYIDERNRLRPQGPASTGYNQWRFTPYLELKRGDDFTAFVQAIDASTFNSELPLLAIDENRTDLLQYYADYKLFDSGYGEKLRVRTGRQLLLYGDQHLVSPLAWSNTYRNFEGTKLYYTSKDWNIDAFHVRTVNGASGNINRPMSFDTPDQSRTLSGVYSTYKNAPKGSMDFYWLWSDEDDDAANRVDGDRHTFGARYYGSHPITDDCGDVSMTYSWDYQGALQTGSDNLFGGAGTENVFAGFVNATNGITFNQAAWTPTITGLFYYGSGDDDPSDGTTNTYYSLYPLGHAYWGMIDNFSGQNLIDYSAQFTVKPTKKLTGLFAYHYFNKAQSEDAIYNVAGVPFGGLPPATASDRHLGQEFDFVLTYAASKNLTLQAGYFWFLYGNGVSDTIGPVNDADQVYFFADYKF